MVKFYFPRDIMNVASMIPPERLKKDLVMVAERDDVVQALCCFYYKGEEVIINAIIDCCRDVELNLLDGLFRSVLFHTSELGCTKVKILEYPIVMEGYFKALGFIEEKDHVWSCENYPQILFSGCAACQAQKKSQKR